MISVKANRVNLAKMNLYKMMEFVYASQEPLKLNKYAIHVKITVKPARIAKLIVKLALKNSSEKSKRIKIK